MNKTIIEFFQESVGATYPIDVIIANLEKSDIEEIIIEYAEYQNSLEQTEAGGKTF